MNSQCSKTMLSYSKEKLFKSLYWLLYLGLCFTSGWFASGVIDNFLSRKTSFSQFEGTSDERPVITISLYQNTELNITYKSDLNIYYCSSYKTWQEKCKKLNIGSNYFTHNDGLNKTEEVFLEKTKSGAENTAPIFRIIPKTNLFDERGKAQIRIYTKVGLNFIPFLYLTSLENSWGYIFYKWKDGQQLKYLLDKNTKTYINIRPKKHHFLKQTSKCHQESYYECIGSELNKLISQGASNCTNKCMPIVFSFGNNYR